jgi:hypothetical protein
LPIKKSLINIRTLFKQIDPNKLTIVINKAYIIGMFSNRSRNTCSKGIVDLLVEMGYGN